MILIQQFKYQIVLHHETFHLLLADVQEEIVFDYITNHRIDK